MTCFGLLLLAKSRHSGSRPLTLSPIQYFAYAHHGGSSTAHMCSKSETWRAAHCFKIGKRFTPPLSRDKNIVSRFTGSCELLHMYRKQSLIRLLRHFGSGRKVLPTCQALERTREFKICARPLSDRLRTRSELILLSTELRIRAQFNLEDCKRSGVKITPKILVSSSFHLISSSGQKCFPAG